MKTLTKCATAVAGAAIGGYAGYYLWTYLRFGRTTGGAQRDSLLAQFMPSYDVAERHRIEVNAPSDVTFEAALRMDLRESPVARALFALRELPAWLTGAARHERVPQPLLDEALALGWVVLARTPGSVVVGAVTRPWAADVHFRGVPAGRFATFAEPGFVKIAWTLAVDGVDATRSIFTTETRAEATDPISREKFRRYWSALSPGILMIRREGSRIVKRAAEARAREAFPSPG